MYFKLAYKNLKKSIKDYSIYFLTLVLGVCIFYTFNSIESQKVMMDLNDMQSKAFQLTNVVISIASIFISFVLGFLIIYANNYLIKRRKKEFGIYMTLGMENKSLSRILFLETILIGMISLVIGVILGVFLSQVLSIFTAKLFKADLVGFKFVFSKIAFIKTIICFGLIYIVVLLFNSRIIRKVKLIELLNSAKKNEKIKVKNIWISVVIFFISILMIGSAYYIVLKNGVAVVGPALYLPVALGAIGTFLFFFSLSGFLLKVVQSNKKFYLKDLNMFVLRQINSKINTTFISMTFICLMLFIAICTLASGLGINKGLNGDIADLTQFDGSLWNLNGDSIEDALGKENIEDVARSYSTYTNYYSDITYSQFLSENAIEKNKNYYPIFNDLEITIMKVSEFNSVLKMLGQDQVKIEKNEYLAFADIKDIKKYIQEAMDDNTKINIKGKELIPANIKVLDITAYDSTMKNNFCTLVVSDEIVSGLTPMNTFLNINFKDDTKELNSIFLDKVKEVNDLNESYIYYIDKENIESTTAGIGAMISYLAIYMGVVFLITSAAVLALQQLCDSADNSYRYELIKKIGVDEKIINQSLLVQIGIYFMVPLSLALVHSIIGLNLAQGVVSIFGDSSMMNYILITVGILILVYGGYFIATYNGAKKIIKSNYN